MHAADELDGDVGRAGHRDTQRREVVLLPVGMVEDRLVEGRRAGQHGHALVGHPGEDAVDVEHRLREHGGAGRHRREDARLQAEHVEVGVDHEVPVAGGETRHRHPVGGDAQRATVGLNDPLRHAGRARREQDVGWVVGRNRGRAPVHLGAIVVGGAGQEGIPRLALGGDDRRQLG